MIYEGVDLKNSLLQSTPFFSQLTVAYRRISLFPEKASLSLFATPPKLQSHPEAGSWVLLVLELQLRESQLKLVKCVAIP